MNESELGSILEEYGAIRHGHFKLSSGRHSDVFVQTALVTSHPGVAERLGHELARSFIDAKPGLVLSPAMAGLVIGHEVARSLGVPMLFCERVAGALELRRGFEIADGTRVLIIDNAMTDGGSKREVIELARSHNAEVVGVGVIVDRSEGVSLGVALHSLLHMATQEWDQADCHLCAAGEPLDAPGSRHLSK